MKKLGDITIEEVEKLYSLIVDKVFPEINREKLCGIEITEFEEIWPARFREKNGKYIVQINRPILAKTDKYYIILLIMHELSHILVGLTPKSNEKLSEFLTIMIDEGVAELVTLAKIPRVLEILDEDEKLEFIKTVIAEFDIHNPAYFVIDHENIGGILENYGLKTKLDPTTMEIIKRSPIATIALLYYQIHKYGDRPAREFL